MRKTEVSEGVAQKRASRDNGKSAPISGHRLFPAVVALWSSAALGLACAIAPSEAFDWLLETSGIAGFLPAGAIPLPFEAHLGLAALAAILGWGLGLTAARRITVKQFNERPASSDRIARIRGLQPVLASEELGGGGFDSLDAADLPELLLRPEDEEHFQRERFFGDESEVQEWWDESPAETAISPALPEEPVVAEAAEAGTDETAGGETAEAEAPTLDFPGFELPAAAFIPPANDDWQDDLAASADEPDELSPEFAFDDSFEEADEAGELPQWEDEAAADDSWSEPPLAAEPQPTEPQPSEEPPSADAGPLGETEFGPAHPIHQYGAHLADAGEEPPLTEDGEEAEDSFESDNVVPLDYAGRPSFRIDASFAENAETADLPNEVPIGLDSFGEDEDEEAGDEWGEEDFVAEDTPPPFDATLGAFRDYARDYIGGDDGEEDEEEEEDEDSSVGYGSLLGLTVRRPPREEPLELVGFDGKTVTMTNEELKGEDLFEDDLYDDESGPFVPLDSPLVVRRRSGGGL